MKKYLPIFAIASGITISLFALMAFMIKNDQVGNPKSPTTPVFAVNQTPPDSKVIEKSKPLPPPPVKPKQMPKTITKIEEGESTTNIAYKHIPIETKGIKTNYNQNGMSQNQDARAMVRIDPKYPIDAAREGKEGWVKLSFNINKIGQVTDIKVLDSQPKRTFDKAAKQALRKWKYKAKIIDGKAVKQTGLSVQLDFLLDKQTS